MSTLNLGIFAHVDAGKTSLTERLLYAAGAIDRLGSVGDGDTTTDTLAIERQRGITIKNNVASFTVDGTLLVNVIDTPGHPDFIAEVERALHALDAAVLVVSAVEGVQAQTRVILRMLRRLRVPTLLFINKVDRPGADPDAVAQSIPDAIRIWDDNAETIAEHDERAFDAYLHGHAIPPDSLPRIVSQARVLPAFAGSAATGQGIEELIHGMSYLLPRAPENADDPLEAVVFAMDRSHIASVRVRAGTLRVRDRIGEERVTSIDDGRAETISAGNIGRVRGLRSAKIGDVLGRGGYESTVLPPPTLSALVVPRDQHRATQLHSALRELAEQDPLIDVRVDSRTGELSVALFGEVQQEVLQETLEQEYGIEVRFGDATVMMRERISRPVSVSAVVDEGGNPHRATLALSLSPSDAAGCTLLVAHHDLPLHIYGTVEAFHDALARSVRHAFTRGPRGWEVIDTHVAVTRSGYVSPETTAGDFAHLTEDLVERALRLAGTELCEPVQRIVTEGPAGSLASLVSAVAAVGGTIEEAGQHRSGVRVIATVGATKLESLKRRLPGLTRGEGAIEATLIGWRAIA